MPKSRSIVLIRHSELLHRFLGKHICKIQLSGFNNSRSIDRESQKTVVIFLLFCICSNLFTKADEGYVEQAKMYPCALCSSQTPTISSKSPGLTALPLFALCLH